ncbi:MAG: putative Ig domain-containing protein [Sphingomonas sp.]
MGGHTQPVWAGGLSWRGELRASLLRLLALFAILSAFFATPALAQVITSLPNSAKRDIPFSYQLQTMGGSGPVSFTISAGTLPTGLTLSTGGLISGTPTVAGPFTFTVKATASGGGFTTLQGKVTVVVPTISISGLSTPPVVGVLYNGKLTASGGTAPYSFVVDSGTLPPGLTLAPDGVVSGTSNVLGTFEFYVQAVDSTGGQGPYSRISRITLTVKPKPITVSLNPSGSRALVPFSSTASASGGTGPYSFAVTSGSLPSGLSLSPGGVLSGTPDQTGATSSFTVTATDSSAAPGPYSGSVNLTMKPEDAVRFDPGGAIGGTVGVPYSKQFTVNGGVAPYTFSADPATVPAGLTFSSSGLLSGTPTTAGTKSLRMTAVDSSGSPGPYSASVSYFLTISSPPPPTVAPVQMNVSLNSTNNVVPLALGGSPAVSVKVTAAPQHGTATASGITIAYTPATGYTGTDSFAYAASNSGGTSPNAVVSVTVTSAAVTIAPAVLPEAKRDLPFSTSLSASGGTAPYGAPSRRSPRRAAARACPVPGRSHFRHAHRERQLRLLGTASDSTAGGALTASRGYTLVVTPPVVALSSFALDTNLGKPFSRQIEAVGGNAPYAFSLVSGRCRPG